ncbi:hypothetical protein ASF10_14680 [Flavobacterium sp. Leaf82]|uniref:HD domain-containing protein n=1 Tax=Flavobacterium sp. Leaf82 TaxID=1736238 RepID=UPI0007007F45|nr:hypothetical protein [Flavobacterium sp. Leaf82]KQO20831.1 hypothetical protein ASF10_14680 [Flavobacterium sp. Leaf82]
MEWINTTFEKEMQRIIRERGNGLNHLIVDFESIRNAMLTDNFFSEIKGTEPDLSDHSDRHIRDVLDKAYMIIGPEEFNKFHEYEIYCLALMILFHDVGNIFGRIGHEAQAKIAEVYNKYRPHINYRAERRIILRGASAHAGTNKAGSKDTLRDLSNGDENIDSIPIRLLELAAILRFADELAEGKQRTCTFLIDTGNYSAESSIYHQYAEITSIAPDRNMGRISITYDIDISNEFGEEERENLKELLKFTYRRAYKLDEERRYTKNYSSVLKAFKYVSIVYNFTRDGIPIDLDLKKIVFEDLYPIPGEVKEDIIESAEKLIVKKDDDYEIEKLISSLIIK